MVRLLDGRRTHDVVYQRAAEGNFVFQYMRER